jgi:hypothetical protein
MSSDDAPKQNVVVKTTRPVFPFPPNEDREPIYTERLIIRPYVPEDLGDLRALRTQPEVMQCSCFSLSLSLSLSLFILLPE